VVCLGLGEHDFVLIFGRRFVEWLTGIHAIPGRIGPGLRDLLGSLLLGLRDVPGNLSR
jgi:hypothetical protein